MNNPILFKTSKIFSYLFIPPVMNLLIFIIYSQRYESFPNNYYGIGISFILGLLLPVIAIIEFRRRGIISNNDATIKEERTIPYLFAIGFSLTGITISSLLELNEKIIMLWMIYLISSILIININKYWKISAHALGASIPLGALFYIQNDLLLVVFILVYLIVCFSRLYLKVHTFLQVLAGSFVGFIVSIILLYYCL